MKLDIKTRNISLTDKVRDMVEGELGKLEKFLPEDADGSVTLKGKKNYVKVEMTIPMKRYTLRVEEEDQDLQTAIDRVRDVMERQIRKYKTRLTSKKRKSKREEIIGATMEDIEMMENEPDAVDEDQIVFFPQLVQQLGEFVFPARFVDQLHRRAGQIRRSGQHIAVLGGDHRLFRRASVDDGIVDSVF